MFSALIIDGDDEALAQIREALEPHGFEFTTTDNAGEAAGMARTATPDIILLRVELPNSSGFTVCNKLRRSDETKYIPVVMYASGVSDDVFNQHANLKTHADHYLRLPFTPDVLLDAVRQLLPISKAAPLPDSSSATLEAEPIDVELEDVELADEPEPRRSAGESGGSIQLDEETDAAFEALMDEPLGNDYTPPPSAAEAAVPVEIPRQSTPLAPQPTPMATSPRRSTPLPPRPNSVAESPRPQSAGGAAALSSRGAHGPSSAEYDFGDGSDEDLSGESGGDASTSSSDRPGFKAQREVIALKTQLNAKKREILSLRDDLESRERAVLDAKGKNRELMAQIGDLEEKLLGAEEKVITAQEQAEAAVADKNTILKREEGFKNRLELAQKKIRDLEEQIEQQNARVEQTERQAGQQIAALQNQLQASIDEAALHTGELEVMRSELAEARSHSDELEQRWRHASQELESVLNATAQLERQLEQSQQAVEAARQQAAMELEQRLREAAEVASRDKEAALRAQSEEHQRELEFEEEQRRSAVERIRQELEANGRAAHAELEGLRAELQKTEEAAHRDRDRLVQELAALRAELEGVNIQLNQTSQQLTGTRSELDGLRHELGSRRDVERRAQQALAVALRVLDGQAAS